MRRFRNLTQQRRSLLRLNLNRYFQSLNSFHSPPPPPPPTLSSPNVSPVRMR
nr:MAG TPA: hypothetical protein [Myoviridae sp. ctict13]